MTDRRAALLAGRVQPAAVPDEAIISLLAAAVQPAGRRTW